MNTFLPYPSFEKSAKVLDNKRLNKQIVECYQILKAITLPDYGWQNHPAVNMWREHPISLFSYTWYLNIEYTDRKVERDKLFMAPNHKSYDNAAKFFTINYSYPRYCQSIIDMPDFIGYEPFHLSHQSNLLRKDLYHYNKYFDTSVPIDLPYYWPSKEIALVSRS